MVTALRRVPFVFYVPCFGRAPGPLALRPLLNVGVSSDCTSTRCDCRHVAADSFGRRSNCDCSFGEEVSSYHLVRADKTREALRIIRVFCSSRLTALRQWGFVLCAFGCVLFLSACFGRALGPLALWPRLNVGVSSELCGFLYMYSEHYSGERL